MSEAQRISGTIRKRRLPRLAHIAVVLLLLAATAGGYFFWPRPALEPPQVDLQGVEPAVALAIRNARSALDSAPGSAESWGRMGMVLCAHQFRDEARACFAEAERLDVEDARWPYFQALILTREDLEAAIRKLRRTVQLCPDQPDAPQLRLADALLVRGQAEQAAQEFQSLVRRQTAHPAARLGLARLALDAGDLQQSLAHAEFCNGSPYTRKAARALRATVLQRLGQHPAASQEMRLAGELPDDAGWPDPYYAELGQYAFDRGSRIGRVVQLLNQDRISDALSALDDLIYADPEWDLPWQFLGHVLLEQRLYARAEHALRRAVKLAPHAADAHFYLGRVLLEQGGREPALAEFQKATELQPRNAMLQYKIGHHLEVHGDRGNAIAALRAAVHLQPDLAVAWRDLGSLLMEDGRAQEALAHLRRALDLNPQDDRSRQLAETIEGKSKAAAGTRGLLKPLR